MDSYNMSNEVEQYEISLWDHTDRFLAVIRTGVDFEGQAYNVSLRETINGEKTLSFSIPMYLLDKTTGNYVASPLWVSIVNEQKIRYIKNKSLGATVSEISDFVIKNFEESREGEVKIANVECKSYALYELSRIGYTAVFNEDTLINGETIDDAYLDFWMGKILPFTRNQYHVTTNPTGWRYSSPTIYEKANIIDYGKIYDAEIGQEVWKPQYQTSTGFTYDPEDVTIIKVEKQRIIKVEKSNIFNILQELAEKFQVWVSFKYVYDASFKVIERWIIFKEDVLTEGSYVFSYGTNINNLKRISNSDDIVTKMYVESVDSEYEDDLLMNIDDAEQNLMKEQFLYNFDYYRSVGLITEIQYINFIIKQSEIRESNLRLRPYQANISNKEKQQQDLIAQQEFAAFQKAAATTVRDNLQKEVNTTPTGNIVVTDQYSNIQMSGSDYIVDLSFRRGIDPTTFSFKSHAKTALTPSYTVVYDAEDPALVSGLNFGTTNPDFFQDIIDTTNGSAEATILKTTRFSIGDSIYGANTYITPGTTITKRVAKSETEYTITLSTNALATGSPIVKATKSRLYISYEIDTLEYLTKLLKNAQAQVNSYQKLSDKLTVKIGQYTTSIAAIQANIDNELETKRDLITALEEDLNFVLKEGNWQDSDYPLKKKSVEQSTVVIEKEAFPSPKTNAYSFTLSGNIVDFDSIQVWKRSGSKWLYKYSRYSDYDIEYGTVGSTKVLILVPVDSGAMMVEQLTSPYSSLIANNSTLYMKYKLQDTTNYLQATVTRNDCDVWQRYIAFTAKNIIHHSIQIYPAYKNPVPVGETQYAPLVEGEDYLIETTYVGTTLTTKVLLNPTQAAYHFSSYPKVIYETNETNQYFYYDAVDVLSRSAYPSVSFDIAVLDLSSLPGYENFIPVVGQKINIVDYEMFPVSDQSTPPFGLSGFISEVNRDFDNPEATSVTISNYKTKFEDIFQKIVATTEAMSAKEKTFETLGQVMNANKTFSFDVLQNTLYGNYLTLNTGTKNSVVWGNEGITVTDVSGDSPIPGIVKIVGNGLFASYKKDDAGNREWTTAITARGINATAITTGQLDTKVVNIWNSSQVRFTWNAEGLFAFGESASGATDYNTFVRLNQEGLQFQRLLDFGTEEYPTGKLYTELGLTWDGLFISGQRGSIKLTSEKGLQVFDAQVSPQERVQIGRLYVNDAPTDLYGLRLTDSTNKITLETSDNGELWLRDKLSVGVGPATVGLYGGADSSIELDLEEIAIWAGNADRNYGLFRVNYGGSLYGQDANLVGGHFSGELDAASGTFIGALSAATGTFAGSLTAGKGRFTETVIVGATLSMAGISGLETVANDIRFWSGSEINDLEHAEFRVYEDGSLYADNATIRGVITATSGEFLGSMLINNGISGLDGSTNYPEVIPFWINYGTATKTVTINGESVVIPDRTDSAFYITNLGDVFAKEISLTNNAHILGYTTIGEKIGDYYEAGIYGNGSLTDPTLLKNLRLWVSPTTNYFDSKFRIYEDGDTWAKSLHLTGDLFAESATLTGSITMDDMTLNGYDSTTGLAYIGSNNYANGAIGWRINNDGSADFNNINVRGKLKSVVFEYNNISAIGGDLYISPSMITVENSLVTITTGSVETFHCQVNITVYQSPDELALWPDDTEFKIQGILYNGITEVIVSDISAPSFTKITDVGYYRTYNIEFETSAADLVVGSDFTLLAGSSLINLGLSGDKHGIHLTAQESGGPFIDIFGEQDTVTRLGNLSGVTDVNNSFGTLEGFGLYSDNVYLKGKLYLPNAGITDEIDVLKGGSPIRMWAGAIPSARGDAPFIITQDGSLYASKGIFSGIVEATNSSFSGTISATAIVIDGAPYSDQIPDQFFVAYDNYDENGDLITLDTNLILKIGANGLSIFEGGLKVYSDWAYAQGESLRPYSWSTAGSDLDPQIKFPYISAIDEGMRMTMYNGHFLKFSHIDIRETFYNEFRSTLIDGNKIRFNYKLSPEVKIFSEMEVDAFNKSGLTEIGLFKPETSSNNSFFIAVQKTNEPLTGNILFNNYLNNSYETFENNVKVGINIEEPTRELDVHGIIGTDEELDIGSIKFVLVGTINTPSYGIDLMI